MEWEQLLCDKRQTQSHSSKGDLRNEFQKDYHRIICSASFRRLQDKTQVYPLDKSDFVRTRLTHSLEVSSFAKSLGNMCFQYIIENGLDESVDLSVKDKACTVLECAGLLHDIGNPPFGHFGEDTIRTFFSERMGTLTYKGVPIEKILTPQMQCDLRHFEGNAQALRLLTKLHYLVDEKGMHLTYGLLNTLIKYPVPSTETEPDSEDVKKHKMGYYLAEEDIFKDITSSTGAVGCRYPLTYLLEAADDIAYRTADIEDGVNKGFLSYHCLLEELENGGFTQGADEAEKKFYNDCTDLLKRKLEAAKKRGIENPELNAVQNWVIGIQARLLGCAREGFTDNYSQIMAGAFKTEVLKASRGRALVKALGSIQTRYVFVSKPIITAEIANGTMLEFMLNKFVRAAIVYDSDCERSPVEKRLMGIISDNYRHIYKTYSKDKDERERLYLRLLLVTDFICGMTDSYAKSLYQQLSGIN